MDHETLVDTRVKEGEELLRALDKTDLDVDGALWLFVPDASTYRLVLETARLTQGRTKTYEAVQKVLSGLKTSIALSDVSIVGPDDNLFRSLQGAISTGRFGRIRVKQSTFNGAHIEDAFIYRIPERKQPAKAARKRLTTRR